MKRTALTLTLALFFGFIGMAWSQVPAQRVIIVDSTGGHAASVSGGNLGTSASVTVDNIQHITSVTHVAGSVVIRNVAGTAVTMTGTGLDVNCTGCSAASIVAVSHVSSALHIAGTINGAQFHVQGLGIPGQAHGGVLTIQGVAGGVAAPVSGTVTANQGGEWNVRHISGSLHVAGISNVGTGTTAATTRMICHSTSAFSATADAVIAHANSGMRIFICSIVLVAAGAESVSIVEGSGSTCGTAKMGIIGGTGGTMALAANGGFSSIAPFPWVASSVTGNAVCLDKSGSGNVSGVITYRGAP